jgi:negative regulator of flagellin synthesis FlgM
MTEKINGQGFRPTDMAGSARRPEGSAATGTSSASAGSVSDTGDTVNFSRSSMVLSELQRAVSALPVVDAGRVDALRLAITSGAYEVDSASVADNMIRLERELS